MYNPIEDIWEDGIPLTSGRSGLASAVIYQPSCSQHYFQENMMIQQAQGREIDERKTQQNLTGSSSMQLRYSSNFQSRGSSNNSNYKDDMGESVYLDQNHDEMFSIKDENLSDDCIRLSELNENLHNNCHLIKFRRCMNHFLFRKENYCKSNVTKRKLKV